MEYLIYLLLVVSTAHAHSCEPCDKSSCRIPTDCAGGLVNDLCRCCQDCAKQVNESCGGLYGTHGQCDSGLKCIIHPEHGELITGQEVGVCKSSDSLTETDLCKEVEHDGCDVINEECICRSERACASPFQFQNKVQCTMRLLQIEEAKTDCSNVGCVVRYSPKCFEDSELVDSVWPAGECCPRPSRCECRREKCRQQLCRRGYDRVLVRRATGKPGHCCDQYQCKPTRNVCDNVKCPSHDRNITCPRDSVKITDRMSKDGCCELPPKCQCKSSVCHVTKCVDGFRQIVIVQGNGRPGTCCDEIECIDATSTGGCRVDGQEYRNGEKYTTGSCRECECKDGISHCSKKQCAKELPCSKNIQWTPPGKCCAECKITFAIPPTTIKPVRWCTAGKDAHPPGDAWFPEPCTRCVCEEDGPQCISTSCQKNCENPRIVEGECCGVCDEPTYMTIPSSKTCPSMEGCKLTGVECPFGFKSDDLGCRLCKCRRKSEVCPSMTSCRLRCPRGYALNGVGCEICECKRSRKCRDMTSCNKECPFGFRKDRNGCERCRCRRCMNIIATCDKQCRYGRQMNKYGCEICKCRPSPDSLRVSSESIRSRFCMDERKKHDDGEGWTTTSGRQCVCRGGVVLCDMLMCPVPHCDHPVVKNGFPCAVCQDSAPHIGDHLTCGTHVEGESWESDACTSCVCNSGRIMCTFKRCEPAPCARPTYLEDHCCPVCPEEDPAGHSGNATCFDQSGRIRAHGSSWRRDMCTSCRCDDGVASCYGDKCPQVHNCQNPVIKRDQCCPQCLEDTSLNMCFVGDRNFSHGEVWSVPSDSCSSCSCVHGNVFCRKQLCRPLPTECKKVELDPSNCCEFCKEFYNFIDVDPPKESVKTSLLPILASVISVVLLIVIVGVVSVVLYRKKAKGPKPDYKKPCIVRHAQPGRQESIVT